MKSARVGQVKNTSIVMANSTSMLDLAPVPGVRLGTVAAGVRKANDNDVVLIELAAQSEVAAVFTRNRFRAAPVRLAEAHLAVATPRYLLINTGNANAGTGAAGDKAAAQNCAALAALTDCQAEQVIPYSTGVIGEPLPAERIDAALPAALASLDEQGWGQAADGIRTTDTHAKGASQTLSLSTGVVTLTGIAKGSGMIRPDMATMLAYIATDAVIPKPLLRRLLRTAVAQSFNRITVDGDTSTNDACTLIATQASGVELANAADEQAFGEALNALSVELAKAIVRDGEGATRLLTVSVEQAACVAEAETVAFCVAESPLVKTALFAGDPNWGRILAAVGRAGIDDLAVEGVSIAINDQLIAEAGSVSPAYDEARAAEAMAQAEMTFHIRLGRGSAQACVWTCDLSYDYVRINAEYRS